jgi:hypothetical protein
MSRACFLTTIDSPEPLNWGLKLEKIATPMVLLCSRDMAEALKAQSVPPHVSIVIGELPQAPSPGDKLKWLRDVCRVGYQSAHSYYWLDARLVYANLSFEFLYSDLLSRAITRFASSLAYFIMPGYEAASFFGGPKAAIEALTGGSGEMFATIPERSSGAVFTPAFDWERPADLNLLLSAAIDEPILHVIGDSHAYNCFTPNTAIGCRANVLVRARDVSHKDVPYAYQFTHHLGSRTMHFAGRPGALLTEATRCRVKAGDAVVWVFGEIDVRCHIVRQQAERGRTSDDVIGTLATAYIDGILESQRVLELARSVVFAPIPPLDNPNYTSEDFPVFGSIAERIDASRQLRATLSTLCERHRILFLDVSAHYESASGDLRWELSDHFCHIASGSQAPAREALYDLLARNAQGEAVPSVRPGFSALSRME